MHVYAALDDTKFYIVCFGVWYTPLQTFCFWVLLFEMQFNHFVSVY